MGVSEILREIKSLPPEQRWQIIERTRETLGPEIPDSFKQGMREIAQGEVIELDDAVTDRGLRIIQLGMSSRFSTRPFRNSCNPRNPRLFLLQLKC